MKKVGIALLGLGTVGGGTYRILQKNHEMIKKSEGIDLEVKCVLERNLARCKELGVDESIVSCDIERVVNDPEIKIVAEFFGGIEPARTFLIKCLLAGKSIVTANKEMFSKHWHELEEAARKGKAGLYFEASCVGGVPIIRTLQESMQGNNIQSLKGIINGTTNYILSKMSDTGADYADTLKEAQDLGYAEANPSADVDGFDATYKLSILSSLAFRKKVPLSAIYREGISGISVEDINYGKELGLTLKLLGISKQHADGRIEARVHPVFIPDGEPLATVKGSFNAVHIVGDAVGDIMLYGRGAGDLPTGSAIVSDIVYAAGQKSHKLSCFKNDGLHIPNREFVKDFESEYYVRMTVKEQVGVLSEVCGVFGKNNVSIRSVIQKGEINKDGNVTIIYETHVTTESAMNKAMRKIEKLPCVVDVNSIIRIEK